MAVDYDMQARHGGAGESLSLFCRRIRYDAEHLTALMDETQLCVHLA